MTYDIYSPLKGAIHDFDIAHRKFATILFEILLKCFLPGKDEFVVEEFLLLKELVKTDPLTIKDQEQLTIFSKIAKDQHHYLEILYLIDRKLSPYFDEIKKMILEQKISDVQMASDDLLKTIREKIEKLLIDRKENLFYLTKSLYEKSDLLSFVEQKIDDILILKFHLRKTRSKEKQIAKLNKIKETLDDLDDLLFFELDQDWQTNAKLRELVFQLEKHIFQSKFTQALKLNADALKSKIISKNISQLYDQKILLFVGELPKIDTSTLDKIKLLTTKQSIFNESDQSLLKSQQVSVQNASKKTDVQSVLTENQSLRTQIDLLKKEIQDLDSFKKSTNIQITNLVKKQQDEINQVNQKHSDALSKITNFASVIKSEISTLKSEISTLKSEISTLKSEISTLKSEISTLKSEISTLKIENPTLKKEIFALNKEVSTLNTKIATLNIEYEPMKSDLKISKNDIIQFKKEIQTLNALINVLKSETLKKSDIHSITDLDPSLDEKIKTLVGQQIPSPFLLYTLGFFIWLCIVVFSIWLYTLVFS